MPLNLKQISDTINYMDERYDANFGDWIRNEDNCKIVGCNLKKYINNYRESEFITVIKWVVKDWTLKSIILFSKKMVIEDLANISINTSKEEYARKSKILGGLVYTWNPIFISEFLLACTNDLNCEKRTDFMVSVLNVFDAKKLSEILSQLESKLDEQTKKELIKKFKNTIYSVSNDSWKRTNSMLESYNIM